jgi:2-oxoisovalerate dehydrogenase E1 component
MGLSINGYKAIVEMQFADFVSTGFNPIVNLPKSHYRWLENADGGPNAWRRTQDLFIPKLMKLTKTPGLKVVYPAFPMTQRIIECIY